MPFLSLLDDRAKTQGSRDPLGFEAVWSQFGRRLVGNLTTITWSLQNFAVALTGFAIANRTSERGAEIMEIFLRYEQLAAYLRYSQGGRGILGFTRVKDRWHKGPISLGSKHQILSNQASYGLWGLYATALSATGLVRGENRTPTPLGEETCKLFFAGNAATWTRIEAILLKEVPVKKKELEELAPAFMEALASSPARKALTGHLLGGDRAPDLQRELHRLVPGYLRQLGEEGPSTAGFVGWLAVNGSSDGMRSTADEIWQIERVLSSGKRIFDYLASQHGEKADAVASSIRQLYGAEKLGLVVPEGRFPRRECLCRYATAMNAGEFREAMEALLQLNAEVMAARSGAPWLEIRNDALQVKMRIAKAVLPPSAVELTQWENSYFLASYLGIFRGTSPAGNEVT